MSENMSDGTSNNMSVELYQHQHYLIHHFLRCRSTVGHPFNWILKPQYFAIPAAILSICLTISKETTAIFDAPLMLATCYSMFLIDNYSQSQCLMPHKKNVMCMPQHVAYSYTIRFFNSLPWYRWPMEKDGLPINSMEDLSMAMSVMLVITRW